MVANKKLTLAFVRQARQVLLGYKKYGFGVGRWNGFGGKVEPGETIEEAAKREMFEESGVEVVNFNKAGVLLFEFENDPQLLEVHVFETDKFQGEPTESNEMIPKWFDIGEVPFDNMWPDDYLWYPYMFEGKKFSGYFLFKDHNTMVGHKVQVVDCLDNVEIPTGPSSEKILNGMN